jgi:ergothioneine biosynthesis protein EgtB
MTTTAQHTLARDEAIAWYRRNRQRTAALFDLLAPDTYFAQPIALRHPIVFYEGHLPAFSFNTLVKKALGHPAIDEPLERLFARGIDPDDTPAAGAPPSWPDRERVRAFVEAADDRVLRALEQADFDRPGHPLLDGAQAVYAILEHEAMHQETMLYMWHALPHEQKRRPDDYRVITESAPVPFEEMFVPGGRVTLGSRRGSIPFGWDNEFPDIEIVVPGFWMERLNVTNGDFLAFVDAGGYTTPDWWTPDDWDWIRHDQVTHPPFWSRVDGAWHWRGMFEMIPLPLQWPVYVSQAEASAYARWRGRRLPTEAEFQRAAYGSPDGEPRAFPWGDAAPDASRGVFDFSSWEPKPVGTHPRGRSAWGIDDLVGNGWEWTSTVFEGFPGFTPIASYPEYSADFFDGQHYVMKGASPVTARELLRPTFRNWFRRRYPYIYTTFRCVRDGA